MQLPGSRGQQQRDHLFVADGTIAAGNTSQLLLPERKSCSFLYIENKSSAALYLEFGGARATVTISSGGLGTFTITNGGTGYAIAPKVLLLGGGNGGEHLCPGATLPGWPAPGDPGFVGPRLGSTTARAGKATAILTSGVVTSIIVDDPGSGYVTPPYVLLENDIKDPNGVADPYFGSTNSGISLAANASLQFDSTFVTTDAIAIVGGTLGQAFTCRWAP